MGHDHNRNRAFVSRSCAKAGKVLKIEQNQAAAVRPGSSLEGSADTPASKLSMLPIITPVAGNDKAKRYCGDAAIVILGAS